MASSTPPEGPPEQGSQLCLGAAPSFYHNAFSCPAAGLPSTYTDAWLKKVGLFLLPLPIMPLPPSISMELPKAVNITVASPQVAFNQITHFTAKVK